MPIDKGSRDLLECGIVMVLRIFLIISVLFCPTVIRADIYRHVDQDGVVHFTNTPGTTKGAQGMMQLMPFTAKRLNVSDPFDPIENIEGGVKYIKELLGTFGGNLVHAVAAYNAGPAAGKKYGGLSPFRGAR